MRLCSILSSGLVALFVSGCALPDAPSGGPKDETPPALIGTEPLQAQTRVSPTSVVLKFDEYVSVAANGGRPIASPPLPGTVRVQMKGKTARISWDGGTLLPDVTYSLALGGTFKDITEGNLLPASSLVFATGARLDSLYWSGRLEQARTGDPLKNWAVGLWPAEAPDSAAYLSLPRYASRTDEDGRFALNFLAAGTYRLLAFDDPDGNSKVNQGEKTQWAWLPDVVAPRKPGDSTEFPTLRALDQAVRDSVAAWPHAGDPEKTGTVRLRLLPAANAAGYVVEWVDAAGAIRWRTTTATPVDTVFQGIPPGRSYLRAFEDANHDGTYTEGDYWTRRLPERGWNGPAVESKANWETETVWDLTPPSSTPARPSKTGASDGARGALPDALRRKR